MTRIIRSLAVLAVSTLAFSTAVGAAPAKAAAKAHTVAGTIQKYDAGSKALTITTAKGSETVMIGNDTHLLSGTKTLAAGDLSSETGAHVRVSYVDANGQKMAQNVRVAAAVTKTAAAKTGKTAKSPKKS